jgi:hypothetical protein
MKVTSLVPLLVCFFVPATMDCAVADRVTMEKGSEAYARMLDRMISSCDFKSGLSKNRCKCLRENAYYMAREANFIRANKQQLIQKMIASDLRMKDYKVRLFVREQYHRITGER